MPFVTKYFLPDEEIQMVDLKTEYENIRSEIDGAIFRLSTQQLLSRARM
jgi:hypothetical protein